MKPDLKENKLLLIFIIAIWVFELILRMATVSHFFGVGLPLALCFGGAAAIIQYGICCLLPGRSRRIAAAILICISAFLYGGQIVYNAIFHTYYTVYSATHGGQVAQFWRDILVGIQAEALPVLCIAAAAAAAVIWLWRLPADKAEAPDAGSETETGEFKRDLSSGYQTVKTRVQKRSIRRQRRSAFQACALLGIFLILSTTVIFAAGRDANSPYDMMFRTNSIDGSISNMGMAMALTLDGQRLVFGFNPQVYTAEELKEETEPQIEYDFNIMDIDFAAMAEAETDSTLKMMNQYFDSQAPTQQNEKTGIFKGKNLIMIVGESYSSLALSEKYTPTLYKMQHDGFNFTNFYNPIWGVSTSDGEYVACTGLLPKAGVWSMKDSSKNRMALTMGNQFMKSGVKTLAYHNHYAEYYGRTESHPNLGYVYKGLGTGLKVKEMWPESDLEMIELTIPEFLTPNEEGKIDPYHVYYMTVSGHLNYNFTGQAMCAKNKEAVADLAMSDPCRAYIACNIELDKAMETLLKALEEAGEAENTVIVISGDHYPYGLSLEHISEFLGHPVEPDFELYKSSLIIYNPGTPAETVEKYCSSLDIIPTLSNLFGLEYDSRLLMGKDIFSDYPALVIFKDKSWITDKAKYNARTKEIIPHSETGELLESYVDGIKNRVENRFTYSRLILENDYYRYLGL